MTLTPQYIEKTVAEFFRRCEVAKAAGGIALRDVHDGTVKVPAGWIFDESTFYFVPPYTFHAIDQVM